MHAVVDERPRDRHALAHSAGELVRIEFFEPFETDTANIVPGSLAAFRARNALAFQGEFHIADHGTPGQQIIVLRDVAHTRVHGIDDPSLVEDRPVRGLHQSGKHVEHRGLAASRRTDQAHELAAPHFEIDVAQRGARLTAARNEALVDAARPQHGLMRGHARRFLLKKARVRHCSL